MKKYLTTIIALAVLAVVASVAVVILTLNSRKDGPGSDPGETPGTEYVRLFNYNLDSVAKA